MQSSLSERPTVPFVLSLVGVIISAVAALVVGIAGMGIFGAFGSRSMMSGMMGGYYGETGMMSNYSPWGMTGWGSFTWLWVPTLAASIGSAVLGVFMMNSSRLDSLRTGSALVIVGAVLAFPTAFGFIIGSLLMVTGGILGLVWLPNRPDSPRT